MVNAVQDLKKLFDGLAEKITTLFDMVSKLQAENKTLQAEVDTLKSQNADIIKRLESLEANDNTPLENDKVSSVSK